MAQFSRTTTTEWTGNLTEGKGQAKAGTGAFSLPVTFPRRIGAPEGGTSPEELIAAAHSVCYAMVIAGAMAKKGITAKNHHVTCTVTADKGDAGIKILSSKLELVAEGITGIDAAGFAAMAKEAEKGCPVSGLIRGTPEIEVHVTVK